MTVRASWTVFCWDCGDWRGERETRAEAIAEAKKAGFVRTKVEEFRIDWLCPACHYKREEAEHVDTRA